jgi:hypothetical protein
MDDWCCFIDHFKELLVRIQKYIFKKLYDNTTMWNLKDHMLTIDIS